MKSAVCAAFWTCRTLLKPENPGVKIGRYTFCEACAKERKHHG